MQIFKEKTRQEIVRHIKRFTFCTAKLGKTFTPTPITLYIKIKEILNTHFVNFHGL